MLQMSFLCIDRRSSIVILGRFPGKAGEEVKRLEERESELLDEIDKHKDTISKLKEDRTHYRKLADDYRFANPSFLCY